MNTAMNFQDNFAVGTQVSTPYGMGHIVAYRSVHDKDDSSDNNTPAMIQIALAFGTLFATKDAIVVHTTQQQQQQEQKEEQLRRRHNHHMSYNAAYESLEKMRKLNLEVQCHELGIECDHTVCTACLLGTTSSTTANTTASIASDFFSFFGNAKASPRNSLLSSSNNNNNTYNDPIAPCLICAAPTCATHLSDAFWKEKIVVCVQCQELFTLHFPQNTLFVVGNEQQQQVLQDHLDRMMDTYDRCLLLLQYSAPFIDDLAEELEESEERNNVVTLGTSSAGVVSGALGVAGAAMILTPAGAPLLMASLLFGGGSAVVQVGNEAIQYFGAVGSEQEPNKVANRIIALHGMLLSVLRIVSDLRNLLLDDSLLGNNNNNSSGSGSDGGVKQTEKNCSERGGKSEEDAALQEAQEKYEETIMAGIRATKYTATGMKVSAAAGSTASASLLSTLNVIPIVGTAFSVFMMAVDAQIMNATIKKIHAGNPCDKALAIRTIRDQLKEFPRTSDLDDECQQYIRAIQIRNDFKQQQQQNAHMQTTFQQEEKRQGIISKSS